VDDDGHRHTADPGKSKIQYVLMASAG